MAALTSTELSAFFLAVSVLLLGAKFFGEIARRLKQPTIVGELIAGILLGPSVFGALSGHWERTLIPLQTGRDSVLWDSLTTLAVTLFLLVAGMDVELSRMKRQKKAIASVSVAGIVLPLVVGFAVAWYLPHVLGRPHGVGPIFFALFFGTALSISALPVIAKTLIDLDLYETDTGTIVIAAATVNDFAGWIIFGVLLAMMHGTSAAHASGALRAVVLTVALAGLTLTIGRWLIHRALLWMRTRVGDVLGFIVALGLLGGAIAEAIGIHAVFGAFLVGIAVGNSPALRPADRATITKFVRYAVAPIFFVSLGLKVNFVAYFDIRLILIVIGIACIGKLVGAKLGARLVKMEARQSWAVAFGLNSRGAMEIVLAVLALQHGLIEPRLFVALVCMALVTAIISGPSMQRILNVRPHETVAAAADSEPLPQGSVLTIARLVTICSRRIARPKSRITRQMHREIAQEGD